MAEDGRGLSDQSLFHSISVTWRQWLVTSCHEVTWSACWMYLLHLRHMTSYNTWRQSSEWLIWSSFTVSVDWSCTCFKMLVHVLNFPKPFLFVCLSLSLCLCLSFWTTVTWVVMLNFTFKCSFYDFSPGLERIKIIRGSTPNEYMVLLKFRHQVWLEILSVFLFICLSLCLYLYYWTTLTY